MPNIITLIVNQSDTLPWGQAFSSLSLSSSSS